MKIKTVKFRGRLIQVGEARAMIDELSIALSKADPVTTDLPDGVKMLHLNDPRWYTQTSPDMTGSMLCFRDPAMGWRSFVLPWDGVRKLITLLTRQSSETTSNFPLH